MFGKRKQDHKHRFAEETLGELPDADAPPELGDDPQLAEALLQLGRNRHASLPEPYPPAADEPTESDEPAEPAEPADRGEAREDDDQGESAGSDAPDRPVRAAVLTAAMLAEPEPEDVKAEPAAFGEAATYAGLRRERSRAGDQDPALQKANDEVAALKAELKRLRSAASATDAAEIQVVTARADELEQSLLESRGRIEELTTEVDRLRSADAGVERERARPESSAEAADEVRAAVERAEAAEKSVRELQSKVSGLTAELERARSEAAAAGVALERVQREAKDQDGTVAAAEERADRLATEIEQLHAAAAKGPAQVERLQREAERERTMRAAMEQAQASQAKAEAALADNLRLARELAANLESQEGLIAALTGLQTEVTEQRAWFEAQLASVGETESQQASVIDTLQAAIQDRDIELEVLRQQLLEAEAKRAEEAAAFVAALERQ